MKENYLLLNRMDKLRNILNKKIVDKNYNLSDIEIIKISRSIDKIHNDLNKFTEKKTFDY